MPDAIASSILGFASSVVVAALAYWFTKRREREAEWRKEKLAYYKAFVESLSGMVRGDDTPEGHKLYAKTTNNLLLFAPQSVIEAVNAYRSENALSNRERWSAEKHDRFLPSFCLPSAEMSASHPETIRPNSTQYYGHLELARVQPNPSIERTSLSWLRQPKAAAHVER